ncbi:MAG: SgcJ/EcaC family oxidoreductase [Neptuniibacter sp.]
MKTQEVKSTITRWAAAFSNSTTQEICSLYTDDAVLMGTLSPFYRNSSELIKEYFDSLFRQQKRSVEIIDIHAQTYGDTATCSGLYTFHWKSHDEQQVNLEARFTFVLVRQSEAWLIAHQHSSALPKNHIAVRSGS